DPRCHCGPRRACRHPELARLAFSPPGRRPAGNTSASTCKPASWRWCDRSWSDRQTPPGAGTRPTTQTPGPVVRLSLVLSFLARRTGASSVCADAPTPACGPRIRDAKSVTSATAGDEIRFLAERRFGASARVRLTHPTDYRLVRLSALPQPDNGT